MFLSQSRHNFLVIVIILLVFIAFTTVNLWKQFTFLAFLAGILLLFDMIFLNEPEFSTSPNYDQWKSLQDAGLHEFESDSGAKNKKMLFNN